MIRTGLAFLITPLISAAIIMRSAGPEFALIDAYGLTCFFGVPLFLMLRWKKRETYVCYASGGAMAAALVLGLILIPAFDFQPAAFVVVLVLSGIGAIKGLCFRAIRGPRIGEPDGAAQA